MEKLCGLTSSEAAKIASTVNVEPRIIQWMKKRIAVKPLLTFADTVRVVNNVMNACIDVQTGYFVPETMDFALRVNIVSAYARIELPEDISLQYTLLYATDLYDTVLSVANPGQIEAIKSAIRVCADGFLRQHDV